MATANVMSTQSNPVMPKSHVGFDSITTQIERKLLKRGFQFNVICVGKLKSIAGGSIRTTDWLMVNRTNGPGQIHSDKHHLRIAPYRLQGTIDPLRSCTLNNRDSGCVSR